VESLLGPKGRGSLFLEGENTIAQVPMEIFLERVRLGVEGRDTDLKKKPWKKRQPKKKKPEGNNWWPFSLRGGSPPRPVHQEKEVVQVKQI